MPPRLGRVNPSSTRVERNLGGGAGLVQSCQVFAGVRQPDVARYPVDPDEPRRARRRHRLDPLGREALPRGIAHADSAELVQRQR